MENWIMIWTFSTAFFMPRPSPSTAKSLFDSQWRVLYQSIQNFQLIQCLNLNNKVIKIQVLLAFTLFLIAFLKINQQTDQFLKEVLCSWDKSLNNGRCLLRILNKIHSFTFDHLNHMQQIRSYSFYILVIGQKSFIFLMTFWII